MNRPSSPPPEDPVERYAEGQREAAECRKCGQPIWIVYHGPQANHTVEPRLASPDKPEGQRDAWDAQREANRRQAVNMGRKPNGGGSR